MAKNQPQKTISWRKKRKRSLGSSIKQSRERPHRAQIVFSAVQATSPCTSSHTLLLCTQNRFFFVQRRCRCAYAYPARAWTMKNWCDSPPTLRAALSVGCWFFNSFISVFRSSFEVCGCLISTHDLLCRRRRWATAHSSCIASGSSQLSIDSLYVYVCNLSLSHIFFELLHYYRPLFQLHFLLFPLVLPIFAGISLHENCEDWCLCFSMTFSYTQTKISWKSVLRNRGRVPT